MFLKLLKQAAMQNGHVKLKKEALSQWNKPAQISLCLVEKDDLLDLFINMVLINKA